MSGVDAAVSTASGSFTRSTFLVKGMDCADEVRLIEERIGRLPGMTGLQFDLIQHRLLVQGSVTPSENPAGPHLHFQIARSDNIKEWWKGTPINPFVVYRNK